jgi:phenol 2-monooxygenase
MGAFGLNASILDSANLAWKLGLVVQNKAKSAVLLPTYGEERRAHAVRVIETSGKYLRFVCGSKLAVPNLHNLDDIGVTEKAKPEPETEHATDGSNRFNGKPEQRLQTTRDEDLAFLAEFFKQNGPFLLGVDCPYGESVVVSPKAPVTGEKETQLAPPVRVKHGVRAPNPRVCFSTGETGYLYDQLGGAPRFHLVLFLSSLMGREVRRQAGGFAAGLSRLYGRFGEAERFNVIVVIKCMPFELEQRRLETPDLEPLWRIATVIYDDRAPDADAHSTWGVNHSTGGLVVIRPDLWVGFTAYPSETEKVTSYFEGFLNSNP